MQLLFQYIAPLAFPDHRMHNMLLPIIALLARLAFGSSVQVVDDPMPYLAMSIQNCIKSLTLQHYENVGETQDKMQTQNKEINSLITYLKLYHLCFQNIWSFCLCKETIDVFDIKDIRTFKPCYVIHVAVHGKTAAFLHEITTRPTFQINLTFTEFVLRRSYAGCTKHYVQVVYN